VNRGSTRVAEQTRCYPVCDELLVNGMSCSDKKLERSNGTNTQNREAGDLLNTGDCCSTLTRMKQCDECHLESDERRLIRDEL